jgi:aldehyde dehydrogenase (NAD+)
MTPESAIVYDSGITERFAVLKNTARKLRTEHIINRKDRLKKLRAWIHANRISIQEAMYADFRKPASEVDSIEIFQVLAEIRNAVTNLKEWTSPLAVRAPVTMLGTKSYIQYEPRGVCLIISPWNYPFLLSAGPLISALAAGNTAVLKPSELTPHVSRVIKSMVDEVFDQSVVCCYEGGVDISKNLLALPFDHIFFTGSSSVGKIVMKAAAETLASVTLELGGKSPVIVTRDAHLKSAAERVAVAKFVNNGQTCIAPDYVLVDEVIADQFIREVIDKTKKLFTENNEAFDQSRHYGRIVNDKHFARLDNLLSETIQQGAELRFGGALDKTTRFIHPTILSNVPIASQIMEEEIFGPILPIISYSNLDEVIAFVNGKPKPLALYVFAENRNVQKKILTATSSGGVCINDCGVHFFHHNLPFGGVNSSGLGKSHGFFGFQAFSNQKPILKQRGGWTTVKAFYPPYTQRSKAMMDWILKFF